MVFGSNWTQAGPKFWSKRLVDSGLATNEAQPESKTLGRFSGLTDSPGGETTPTSIRSLKDGLATLNG